MLLIKIHGTSGAGKTTAVRDFMALAHEVIPQGKKDRPEAYELDFHELKDRVYVLGSYENTCGGMDSVPTSDQQIALIHKYAAIGHVVYEGLLMSTYYGKLGEVVHHTYGSSHVWAFMDTPIQVCIDRVKKRRLEAGNVKPLNEDNTRGRVKSINALRAKLRHKVAVIVDIRHDDNPSAQLLEILEQGERGA